jgi:hypothetical protein
MVITHSIVKRAFVSSLPGIFNCYADQSKLRNQIQTDADSPFDVLRQSRRNPPDDSTERMRPRATLTFLAYIRDSENHASLLALMQCWQRVENVTVVREPGLALLPDKSAKVAVRE